MKMFTIKMETTYEEHFELTAKDSWDVQEKLQAFLDGNNDPRYKSDCRKARADYLGSGEWFIKEA